MNETENGRLPRVAFVRVKSFSGINEALTQELRRYYRITADIDAYGCIDPAGYSLPAVVNMGMTLLRYGPAGRRGSRILKTPFAFRAMSRYADAQLARVGFGYDFILQTQTLCGCGMGGGGVPYVIYTDCTDAMAARVYPDWRGPKALARLERDVLLRADYILLHNETARASVIEDYGVDESRTALIGCAAPLPDADQRPSERKRSIACITTDYARHRVGVLREAYARYVRPDHPDVELVLAGVAPPDDEPLREGERLLGRLDRDGVRTLLLESLIYAMPSKAGGCSSVLEAMGVGCACVVSAGNPLMGPEIRDEETALVAPTGNANEIGERLRALIDNPDHAQALGERASAYVREYCSWPAVTRRLVAAVNEGVLS